MIRKVLLPLLAVAGLLCSAPVHAQLASAVPVASCNSKSYTAGVPAALTQTTGGELCDTGSGGGGGGGTSSTFGAAFPSTGTAAGFKDSTGTNMVAGNLDASGYLKVNVAAGGAGGGAVYGPTAVGSAAANPPVLAGGTADATATGTVQVNKVDSGGDLFVNLAKVGGSVVALGSTTSTASIPVVIASDQAAVAVKQATAANLNATVVGTGTFADQSTLQTQTDTVMVGGINVKEINAVTPLMGNGVTGTGSQRVTIASDNTAFAVLGQVSTNNANVTPHICGSTATVSPSTATDTQIVAISGSTNIYVCGVEASSNGADNYYLESATGGSCTGLTKMGGTYYTTQYWLKVAPVPYYRGVNTGAGNALCVNTSAAQNISVTVYYDQY